MLHTHTRQFSCLLGGFLMCVTCTRCIDRYKTSKKLKAAAKKMREEVNIALFLFYTHMHTCIRYVA
jgi:hypothetical protein